jgi:hypothetical protein
LLLGISDLHSEQAVEVAEATMNGLQPSGKPFTCSSSDSEDDSYGDDGDQLRACLFLFYSVEKLKSQK